MALTLFLFKVANLDILKSKHEAILENEEQLTPETPTVQFVTDENTTLLTTKVTFRGSYK